ncbi:MAG: serine--tRNA ligase [Dehalococcoidia bacterium]
MLSIQTIRERTDEVRQSLADRHTDAPLDAILAADELRRSVLADVERMRHDRNDAGKRIGAAKDAAERQRLIEAQRSVASDLDRFEAILREAESELESLLLYMPNIPHPDVPVGGEEDSVVILEGDGAEGWERRLETPVPIKDWESPAIREDMHPHWHLGPELGVIDFERGTKISGSPFYILKGDGARLQRALITWMLDVHREQGYTEVYPPFLVRDEMLIGTGQLPKFANTMFHAEDTDLWLVPTAEVPVTNMYRDEILDAAQLPLRHAAYTPCFRHEQFSAGRDVRGIKRGYQFDKVEMVQFVAEDRSWEALDRLVQDALDIVRPLGLRYRLLRLATGDLTFASAMTYDIEVWAPGANEWLEVSSVSNFLDFQARRANLRYRDTEGRVRHLHTLNGSGVALPRTLAAILETHQQPDGSVTLPSAIRPYLGGLARIGRQ